MFEYINWYLLFLFAVYIGSLCIGFLIKSKKKDTLNKRYKKYKRFLTVLLWCIFLCSGIILVTVSFMYYVMGVFLFLHILFYSYLLFGISRNTRCWKQHRVIYYHFYLILILYICSLLIFRFNSIIFGLVLLISVYTILEFQFAKFSFKQTLMWDWGL